LLRVTVSKDGSRHDFACGRPSRRFGAGQSACAKPPQDEGRGRVDMIRTSETLDWFSGSSAAFAGAAGITAAPGTAPGIKVLDEFIDCARLVADFRYVVKRKIRPAARIHRISFGDSGMAADPGWTAMPRNFARSTDDPGSSRRCPSRRRIVRRVGRNDRRPGSAPGGSGCFTHL